MGGAGREDLSSRATLSETATDRRVPSPERLEPWQAARSRRADADPDHCPSPAPAATRSPKEGSAGRRSGDTCMRPSGVASTSANQLRPPVVPTGETIAGITGFERLQPGIRGRDERGMKEAGGRLRLDRQQKMPICRSFTGATGLEPATSGVTGRSWRFRAARKEAAICRESRAFLATACGDCRGPAGAYGDLPRDVCGMCPLSQL
jgi:hypothetical protein